MSNYVSCPKCHKWGFTDQHTCQPAWNVWDFDEDDENNTEEYRTVYARTAGEAAESCAHSMNDDGPIERMLFVRKPDNSSPAELFSIGYEINIDYIAEPKSIPTSYPSK